MKKTYNNPTALICAISSGDIITTSGENFFDPMNCDYVVYASSAWGMDTEG